MKSVPGEFVVKLRNIKGATQDFDKSINKISGASTKRIWPDLGIAVIKLSNEKTAQKQIKQNPLIERIEPNFIYSMYENKEDQLEVKINDPKFSELWGLSNIGQLDSMSRPGIPGIDINAKKAWSIQTGSRNVIVGVIDTGINYKHPDLQQNMWVNEAEQKGQSGVDDDENGFIDDVYGWNFITNTADPMDDNGHGTHCSGIIGAKGNDEKGIVGVAWNTRIMALKFLDEHGEGTLENAIRAIDYSIKNGAKVLNNSWGGGEFSEMLKEAIERSNQNGQVFVAAAGNDSSNNDTNESYPASYSVPNIISVAAIDNTGKLANFSNYGKRKVHLGAPGVNILSSVKDDYKSWSGTSMAAPHVSGAATLLASQYPDMNGVDIKSTILNSAKPIKGLKGKTLTGGMLDAYNALLKIELGPDMNDPMNWTQSQEYVLSTEHPYKAEIKDEWEVRVPGANQISIYFEKFDTESVYDTVEFFDEAGKLVQTMSGLNHDTFSDPVSGNYVKIKFKTDKSLEKYGFDITKVVYK